MAKQKLFESYHTTAADLIKQYNGSIPLNDFLKQYFAQQKKFGSRDRKHITHLCYCFYRLGYALKIDVKERVPAGLFLCSFEPNELLGYLHPGWNEKAFLTLDEKLAYINQPLLLTGIFPWSDELSEGIDTTLFAKSYLILPDLFLRIRPGKKEQVITKFQQNKIPFKEFSDDCVALANTTKVDVILEINKEVVIQDYNSQRISEFLLSAIPATSNRQPAIKVWDCCAASGGKSILAVDTLGNIELTVSDLRPSIIRNLKRRFKEAGIKNYRSFIADLTNSKFQIPISKFDLIICDAPCSGSGTWSRSPEQLYFFTREKIEQYAGLQKKIVSNVITYLKKDGFFLYITCSVFKKENEEVVDFIQKNHGLKLVKKEILKGYDIKADTMFAALFTNFEYSKESSL